MTNQPVVAPHATRRRAAHRRVARVTAGLAAVAALAGAVSFVRAVVLTQGWWYSGFVSEAGEPGAPHGTGYRWGILGLAAALVLLAVAVLARGGAPAWIGLAAAGLLLAGAALATTSSLVTCSAGCPLPPLQSPTPGDLVHAAASVLGLAAVGAVIALYALGPLVEPWWLGRLSLGWLILVLPLFAAAGASLLLLGRGYTTGTTEKVLILVIIGWAFTASARLALERR